MADDNVPNVFEIRPAGERLPLRSLNEALGLPADTAYATLSSPEAMAALNGGQGQPVAVPAPEPVAAVTRPAPLPPEPVAEAVLPPVPPAPKPAPAAPAQAAVQDAEAAAEGKFASMIRNAEGKIRKGPAFAIAAIALGAAAYGVHKLREPKSEAPSR